MHYQSYKNAPGEYIIHLNKFFMAKHVPCSSLAASTSRVRRLISEVSSVIFVLVKSSNNNTVLSSSPESPQEVALVLELPLRSSATLYTLLYFFWMPI